jgi:putative DNA methylase
MTYRKKLIEVALPLPEINDASAYDKMPGIGPHPKGIHHWWARLPLPTARAILFASVVDDPSEHPERWPTDEAQNAERERLFVILRKMMGKKLHEHREVYAEARAEMLLHCDGKLPTVFDPFAGGGSIPLEANRLGFEAHAGDLNPVAVLLNKCSLELAPHWANYPPVNPEDRLRVGGSQSWQGTHGLAADVRYYGKIIRERAIEKIGHLYPKVALPRKQGGGQANVIAWIWARTVASPNPAAQGKHVPLISTYWLSSKKGNLAWLEPVVDKPAMTYRLDVRTGIPDDSKAVRSGTKLGRGANFRCLLTGQPISDDYVKDEGQGGRFSYKLLAIVADIGRGRIYLPGDAAHDLIVPTRPFDDVESGEMPNNARWFSPPLHGFKTYTSIFTPRQLTAMVTLSDLIKEIGIDIAQDAASAGIDPTDAKSYSDTVTTFLALTLDRCADFNNALCRWKASGQQSVQLFARQAIPMVWDFVEPNILGEKAVCWHTAVNICADAVETITPNPKSFASARQIDAATGANGITNLLVSTDPPYYDNIGYAALSDFFYVWLRRTIGSLYPDIFSTVLVPKIPELTASPDRFDGNKAKAKEHFESGFRQAFTALRDKLDPRFPLTVYYAFKQADDASDHDGEELDSNELPTIDLTTGWETLLEALVSSGFQITGTWPVRASQKWRMVAMGTNALASYIVLACRHRSSIANQADRRSFIAELRHELPIALRHLQQGNIAPVDFAQASIGPGMAIYSKYSRILESNGQPMSVRTALGLINDTLTQVLTEAEEVFDNDTRWALCWFEQHGFDEGDFGDAELLSKAKVTSVEGLRDAGIVASKGGKVRILRREELPIGWNPAADGRLTVWEACEHLIYALQNKGEAGAAELLVRLPMSVAEAARDLAYRLFTICESKGWAQEALPYNSIVIAWPEIGRLAQAAAGASKQEELL